jgi:hypothetical protein
MPTYQQAEHGSQISWEYLEAASIAPVERVMLHAFEMYHPLSGRHRFVADHQNLLATLEATAPADPGIEVEWLAVPLTVSRPDQNDSGQAPQMSISLDNVAGLMALELDKTRGSRVSWEITERIYASDDTTGPHVLPPTTVLITDVSMQNAALSIRARTSDPGNVAVPRTTFKRIEYSGLQR